MTVSEREIKLDPINWYTLKALDHRILDDMLTHQQTIRSQQFSFAPKAAIQEICVPLTFDGDGEEKVYDVFVNHILPYTMKHTSPLFWGWSLEQGRCMECSPRCSERAREKTSSDNKGPIYLRASVKCPPQKRVSS